MFLPISAAVFFYFYEVAKDVSKQKGLPMWAASMVGTAAAEIVSFHAFPHVQASLSGKSYAVVILAIYVF